MSLVEKALNKMKLAVRAQSPEATSQSADGLADAPRSDYRPDTARPAPIARNAEPLVKKYVNIDADSMRSQGYLPPQPQERELVEQYRHIKRPLVARALGRSPERVERGAVIMVTSALPGEGKTFTAINLTRAIALEKDASVLLVDGDVANPQVSRVLGIEHEAGLVDALCDPSCDVESLVIGTSFDGLEVLSAGRYSDTASELLGSQRMHEIIHRLITAEPNRIILIDSPPMLITNESKTLGGLCGQIVLVVHSGVTPQQAVLEAIDSFPEGKQIGLVLNQSDHVTGLGYGYYGTKYGYGYGDARRAAEASAKENETA
jgi:exopolysaccharide/PEP-CTERM locus tyrosine autokinase